MIPNSQRLNTLPARLFRPALIWLILALALGLRLWGINFGLPHRYHVDEPYYVLGALQIGQGNFEMVSPQNAPNLWQFILFAEYALLYVIGHIAGYFTQPVDLAALYLRDPSIYYLLARVSSILAGVATVGLAYKLGARLFGRAVGLAAALLLAVLFMHVRESHYGVNDAFITLLTTFSLYSAVVYLKEKRAPLLLLGAAAVGAAIGMKYRPVVFALPLFVAVLAASLQSQDQPRSASRIHLLRMVALVTVICGIGFLVGYPGIILNPINSQIHAQAMYRQVGAGGTLGISWGAAIVQTIGALIRLLEISLGVPMLIAAVIGFVLALLERRLAPVLLALTALFYFLLNSVLVADLVRYLLPLAPLVCIFAALAVSRLVRACVRRLLRAPGRADWRASVLAMALLVLVAVIPAARCARYNYLLTMTDTRTLAKAWIEKNLPAQSKIALDWPVHGPPLATATDPEPESNVTYELFLAGDRGLTAHSLQYYVDEGFQYIVTSSYIANMEGGAFKPFYASLDSRLELLQEFSPTASAVEPPYIFDEIYGPIVSLWDRERPGPVLKVYRVPQNAPLENSEDASDQTLRAYSKDIPGDDS